MSDALTKAEQLQAAGYMAPRLRSDPERLRAKKIKTVDADGNVVREIDALTLNEKMRVRAGIEFDTPDYCKCAECGVYWTRPSGRIGGFSLARCPACRSGRGQDVCAGHDGIPCPTSEPCHAQAFRPARVAARNGAPWICRACTFASSELKRVIQANRNPRTPKQIESSRKTISLAREAAKLGGNPGHRFTSDEAKAAATKPRRPRGGQKGELR